MRDPLLNNVVVKLFYYSNYRKSKNNIICLKVNLIKHSVKGKAMVQKTNYKFNLTLYVEKKQTHILNFINCYF